jgi:hypothetical protein
LFQGLENTLPTPKDAFDVRDDRRVLRHLRVNKFGCTTCNYYFPSGSGKVL